MLLMGYQSSAQDSAPAEVSFPDRIANPHDAIEDPVYSDPVFWWRMTNRPENIFEPDPYFYWPEATIEGVPGPFAEPATEEHLAQFEVALDDMASWAEMHKSYALIVVHRGKLLLEQYWDETDPEALTNGRALTRSVTPMVLGFAVADGALSLNDPIGTYIPEWRDDPRGDILVLHLAQNASGLEVAEQMGLDQILGNKDLCLVYCGDVIRAALSYGQAAPPGSRFDVAQENMQLLALVIERATGTPIQDLLSERLWQRIGASDAAFQLDRPDGAARVMCCMRALPRDWARLGLLLLNDGKWQGEQVLPEGWVEAMSSPSPTNPNFGIGLWIGSPYTPMRTYFQDKPGVVPQSEPFLAKDVVFMEGGGFRTVYVVPSEDLMIMRLGHFDNDWDHAYLVNTFLSTR